MTAPKPATVTPINADQAAAPAAPVEFAMGENVMASVEGSILTLRIDTSKRLRASGTGKTTIVATTGGNILTPAGVTIGVNAYVKN